MRSLRRRGTEFASAVMVRRAQVVGMSSRGYSAPEIADALDATGDWVRTVHEFRIHHGSVGTERDHVRLKGEGSIYSFSPLTWSFTRRQCVGYDHR